MDMFHCWKLVIASQYMRLSIALINTKVCDMNIDNIRRLTTQCFELCWKSTIVTSQHDDSLVPCVRVTRCIYRLAFNTFFNKLECLHLSYA